MNKLKKSLMAAAILVGTCVTPIAAFNSYAQGLTDAEGNAVEENAAKTANAGGGFKDIVFGSGIVGMLLWFDGRGRCGEGDSDVRIEPIRDERDCDGGLPAH